MLCLVTGMNLRLGLWVFRRVLEIMQFTSLFKAMVSTIFPPSDRQLLLKYPNKEKSAYKVVPLPHHSTLLTIVFSQLKLLFSSSVIQCNSEGLLFQNEITWICNSHPFQMKCLMSPSLSFLIPKMRSEIVLILCDMKINVIMQIADQVPC